MLAMPPISTQTGGGSGKGFVSSSTVRTAWIVPSPLLTAITRTFSAANEARMSPRPSTSQIFSWRMPGKAATVRSSASVPRLLRSLQTLLIRPMRVMEALLISRRGRG